ncbi:hypothetical protein BDR03DRAFT_599543 [Suillus americanus]|nr:hypothetical protein BDR03DRAFT_599543 [Suillus americanus]
MSHTPLAAAFPMTGCRQAHPIDSYEEPFPEFTDSNIASQGSLNHSGMSYSTSPSSYDNHHPLNLSEENQCRDSVCLLNGDSPHYSGVMHASLPNETSLFVANYLHQLRLTIGTDMTLDQAIQICVCGGQLDTPDPKPTHGQMGRDDLVSNISSPSTSYTGGQFSRSATRQSTPSGRAYFRSSAVTRVNHEIFRDGSRLKVRCHEGPCSGNVLMKDNYARHVREHHLGGKRKAGGSSIRRVIPGMK